ncbi:non-hydrolyzing UDP-N-acetylglucosamine 2-epimerase [Candidatus Cardinium hertigii]|uniref:UDP-N-acetylglucosamine 2-epimerase (non-hydrolyzing) n=1 Tax=Candidatus Cardinium hertigii TaxID=247481 RepID=A0A3N2QDB5_9BACT|nr:UDP-N-acetylglucosamine 2-epimerase (non-hydrolyzing) [Candidatus Cardinium hertigii]ROT47764.1 UDP-N-acetylglucosamine 2-epimerase (non-hydrolyzing) [Candidatus Cardinium hertigii]
MQRPQFEPIECYGELTQSAIMMLPQLDNMLKKLRPDVILVQGDTTTAFLAALAGFYAHIPVIHIETGLRTGNIYAPWPEEMHRCFIDKVSSYFFAPTHQAKNNLIKEGVSSDKIWVVGNTSIDAIRLIYNKGYQSNSEYKTKFILVTIHRRENHGKVLKEICSALRTLAKQFPKIKIVFCLHPNPPVSTPAKAILSNMDNIDCIPPVDHIAFIKLLKACSFVITDSGGIQEEVTFIEKPILVVRSITERPEVIESGRGILVGTSKANIIKTASTLLNNPIVLARMSKVHFPYGDGYAAQKIVHILEQELKK